MDKSQYLEEIKSTTENCCNMNKVQNTLRKGYNNINHEGKD